MTPFEQKLANTPRREIPPEWRARLLATARPGKFFPALTSSVSALLRLLLSLFQFPHPLAWGAVAAAWIVIAALNLSGPRGEELYAVTPKELRGRQPVNVREYFVQVQWQHELLRTVSQEHGYEIESQYVLDPKTL